MNEIERQIQFEKECRQVWVAICAACCPDTRVTDPKQAIHFADKIVVAYRERFNPNEE